MAVPHHFTGNDTFGLTNTNVSAGLDEDDEFPAIREYLYGSASVSTTNHPAAAPPLYAVGSSDASGSTYSNMPAAGTYQMTAPETATFNDPAAMPPLHAGGSTDVFGSSYSTMPAAGTSGMVALENANSNYPAVAPPRYAVGPSDVSGGAYGTMPAAGTREMTAPETGRDTDLVRAIVDWLTKANSNSPDPAPPLRAGSGSNGSGSGYGTMPAIDARQLTTAAFVAELEPLQAPPARTGRRSADERAEARRAGVLDSSDPRAFPTYPPPPPRAGRGRDLSGNGYSAVPAANAREMAASASVAVPEPQQHPPARTRKRSADESAETDGDTAPTAEPAQPTVSAEPRKKRRVNRTKTDGKKGDGWRGNKGGMVSGYKQALYTPRCRCMDGEPCTCVVRAPTNPSLDEGAA